MKVWEWECGRERCNFCMLYTERGHEWWHVPSAALWTWLSGVRLHCSVHSVACVCLHVCFQFDTFQHLVTRRHAHTKHDCLDTSFNSCHFNSHTAITLATCRHIHTNWHTLPRRELLAAVLKSDGHSADGVWRSDDLGQFIAARKGILNSLESL